MLRIWDVYPGSDFHPSRIRDPKKATKDRGVKKLVVIPFFVAINFMKLKLFFLNAEEKIWANFQRIIELFIQKIVAKLSKIWILDLGSGKNLFRILDPGVKKAPDPDPQH